MRSVLDVDDVSELDVLTRRSELGEAHGRLTLRVLRLTTTKSSTADPA